MNKTETNYDNLISDFLNGNESAFYALVKDWKDIILNYCFYQVNDRELAEEITQDVFMAIWKTKKYHKQSNFKAWIYMIAKNKIIDIKRKKSLDLDSLEAYEMHLTDDKNLPEKNFLRQEEYDSIQKIIAKLPEEHRNYLILSQIQELKNQEISDITGFNVNSVKGKVFRALKYFVDHFKEKYDHDF